MKDDWNFNPAKPPETDLLCYVYYIEDLSSFNDYDGIRECLTFFEKEQNIYWDLVQPIELDLETRLPKRQKKYGGDFIKIQVQQIIAWRKTRVHLIARCSEVLWNGVLPLAKAKFKKWISVETTNASG